MPKSRSAFALILMAGLVGAPSASADYALEWQSPQGVYFPNISDVSGPAPFEGYDVNGDGNPEFVWMEYEGDWGGPQTLKFHAIDGNSHGVVWLWSTEINESEGEFCQLLGFYDLDEDGYVEGLFKFQDEAGDAIAAVNVSSGGIEWQIEDWSIWVEAIFDLDMDGYMELILHVDETQGVGDSYLEIWGGDFAADAPHAPPAGLMLWQNHPNPFNPSTRIEYSLNQGGPVELRIISPSGRSVRTLLSANQEAGDHALEWDGRDDRGRRLPSGAYYYELRADGQRQSRKLILLK